MPKKIIEPEDICDFEDDECLLGDADIDDDDEEEKVVIGFCSCCGQPTNDCTCLCDVDESPIATEIRDIIESAIANDTLPELSNGEKEELIQYILNDDSVWAEFDFQLGLIFMGIHSKGMDSIRDPKPLNIRCPIFYEV